MTLVAIDTCRGMRRGMTRNPYTRSMSKLHILRGRVEQRVARTGLVVALLGAGGRELAERRRIAGSLSRRGFVPLVPQDAFPRWISPSLIEEAVLSDDGIGLVFLKVGSWGSAAELGQLRGNPSVAPKLRILVPPAYHPLHGDATGYLSDMYLTHLSVYGHVYAVDGRKRVRLPPTDRLILVLAERFRQVWALGRG